MKKIATIFIAFALVLSISTTVFAADPIESDGGFDENDVTVIVDKTGVGPIYSVDIEWDSLQFTYSLGSGTWNPTDHTVSGGTAGWDKDSANIKVTNHSNVDVSINAAFAENAATAILNEVTATLSGHTFDLNAGKLNQFDSADTSTATVQISGTPSIEDTFVVGTITVTVSAKN